MAVDIRKATSSDYAGLSELFEEVDSLHYEQVPEIFRRPRGPARPLSEIASLIVGHDSAIFVAEVDGALAGCVIVYIWQTRDRPLLVPLRYAMVDTIVVRSMFRGMGVGHRLMKAVEVWAEEHGLERIELNVFEFNTGAIAFYESLGYETLSRRLVKRLDE